MSSSASRAMRKIMGETKENYENSCVVCFIEVSIFSVGSCDHAVCYVCSTRMRVLCGQNECPICRQELSKVIFSYEKHPFRQLEVTTRSGLYDKSYRIVFGDLVIQNAFYKLLENACPRCECQPFISFDLLRKHVQREHELFYCELCTDNLKIFTFERRCYTREELAMHKRKGDPDNTSHRGHPLCEYCDVRFLDRDELFRHLRREHFFCHFCDADGSNHFYSDYSSLRDHFRQEHYLCEEGNCIEEQFTAVFRTDIDLRAHKASTHSKSMGKLATKQARTLEVEFFLAPRNRNLAPPNQDMEGSTQYRPLMGSQLHQQPQKTINANDEQEFPALGGASSNPPVPVIRPSVSIKTKSYGGSALAKTKENFPALGGAMSVPSTSGEASSTKQYSKMVQKPPQPPPPAATPPSTSKSTVIHISNRPQQHPDVTRDFPALPKSAKIDQPPPAITVNPKTISSKYRGLVEDSALIAPNNSIASKLMMVQKPVTVTNGPTKKAAEAKEPKVPKLSSEDNFPTLSASSSALTTPPSWVTLPVNTKNKVESRKSKVAPAPDLSHHQQQQPVGNTVKTNSAIKNDEKNSQKKKSKAKTKEKDSETKTKPTDGKNPPKEPNNNSNSIVNDLGALKISKKDASSNHQASLPPPPGFDATAATKGKINGQPPPGFNSVTLNSVSRKATNNNLTFTNSTGESYSIIPTKQYIRPPNCEKRNEVLLSHFKDALKSHEALKEFHNISRMFLDNQYNAQPYYDHCLAVLGDKFNLVFPELLTLMPNIGKQQELYLVHAQREKLLSKKNGRQANDTAIIDVCSLCKQVLLREDLFAHLQMHKLENNFPVLSK